ncbi:MFS-type transporter SLC18B1 isoform X4 [Myotis daubentonii]|uniref:MFS-type transporter SLC18B1 isoform X4 n=1 Tax=Myotis daubentonii TaxID=98922 RepID=UPI002872E370|nr:MFS-type transporter SLC18B1 isoform X4 [Myotis daubentonii]
MPGTAEQSPPASRASAGPLPGAGVAALGPGSGGAGVRAPPMDAPGDPEGPPPPAGDDPAASARETSSRLSREQLFVLISAASMNFGCMMSYSILGPFFPKEAEKKGASNTVIGMIFGCYALFELLASLFFGKYLVQIGAKFMFVSGMFVSGGVTILFGENNRCHKLCCSNNCIFFYPRKGFPKSCGHSLEESNPGQHSFWKLISLPKVALLTFIITSLSACFGFLDPTLSLFVLKKFNLPAGHVGLVFLGLALSYTISSPLCGLLSDKIPHLRKWFLVFGNIITAGCYMLLGPVPVLHIQSQLWLLVLMLVVIGISSGMSIIPTFPEIISCAHENGFEEGLSTLALVSGLFSAMWSVGAFMGPTLGGFLYEKIGFEWAAAVQGLWALTSGLSMGLFYLLEYSRRRRRSKLHNILGTEEEQRALLPDENQP